MAATADAGYCVWFAKVVAFSTPALKLERPRRPENGTYYSNLVGSSFHVALGARDGRLRLGG